MTTEGEPARTRSVIGSEYAIVFAADEGIAQGLAVAMYSALANLRRSVRPAIYVLDNGLSETSRARVRKLVDAARRSNELRWIRIPTERLGPVTDDCHFTPASYSRLLIPELVPGHVRRAVYLDADVLVMRDLSPLFSVELGGALVGAVRDYFTGSTVDEQSGVRERTHPRPYFNAGLLVIDVAGWRGTGLAEQAMRYARTGNEPLRWADQDALNAVVESWHELDYRWNVQQRPTSLFAADFVRTYTPTEERIYRERWNLYRAAAVLHFIGRTKPWSYTCNTAGTTAWVRTLMRSGWYAPVEALIWLVRWYGPRLRYRLGTAKRRWRMDPSERT